MLLFFRSASATITATIAGVGAVAAAGSTVSATIAGIGGMTAPNSVELMIFANITGVGGVTAISQGFLSRTAAIPGFGDITAFGGYGATLTFNGVGNVSATVGSFFDGGAVTLAGTGAVSVAGRFVSSATIAGLGSMTAVPIISGGTISSAATLAGIGAVSVSAPVQTAIVNLDGLGDISATGTVKIDTLATQMRLSFSSDTIRTFFRRG